VSNDRLNVLLVDDEPRVLDGLRRQLRVHRQKWDMRFAGSGVEALAMLAERPADIVVSDMRMPGMSGGQLLREVRVLYPQTTRVILSGQTDQDDLLRDLGCIHHYLQKPCDAAVICAAIERTHQLSARLRQPKLQIAANRVISLPPSNDVYRSLVEELARPDASIDRVGEIVARDPALTAKLMQLVNSAFFGVPRFTASAQDAVTLLGLKTINSVVVTARIFDFIGENAQDVQISSLWETSLRIGEAAGRFAAAAGASVLIQQQSRLAGILCLVGRAILMTSEPEQYRSIAAAAGESGVPLHQLELLTFGASQDEVAAYALGKWAFADEIVDAVARQTRPGGVPDGVFSPLLPFLHLARCNHTPSAGGLDECPTPDEAFITRSKAAPARTNSNRTAA
jgi:HD-like signal output (HDOD) protein